MKRGILVLLAALSATAAVADDGISLGIPSYGGSGCPDGTASVTLSPDSTALSILFDQYQAEAGGSTGKSLDRKACAIAIPVHVPQGFSVSVMDVDYRGFNAIPQGGMSQFNVEYFFAGMRGPSFAKRFVGPIQDNYELTNEIQAMGLVWSACGADVILRSNSSILARTNFRGEDTLSTVDSADVSAALVYHLQWRSCN